MNPSPLSTANGSPTQSMTERPHLVWGAPTAAERGPVIATLRNANHRNAVGSHAGGYSVYRALAIAARTLAHDHIADLTDTAPVEHIGPHPQWCDAKKIVSLDPWGHLVGEVFRDHLARGYDVRPTIAVTRAHIDMPEIRGAIAARRIRADGDIVSAHGSVRVMKAAIDPVWHLPGIAERFGLDETDLRRGLHEQTGGMYPELVTRPELKVFLPPIGGTTIYCFGDPAKLGHGVEIAIQMAQAGGIGLVVYNRKEGRALGEVTKFLVYNARKRQKGGDRPEGYFKRTECIAGVQDMRFQELMPDVLHWLGITRIDRFASMSDMKCDALERQGITIGERVPLPEDMIPPDARVEIEAKLAAGYFAGDGRRLDFAGTVGRGLDE